MIRTLKIQCPKCHHTCELYLSTHAPIVILNCPSCWTPMLYNENGVFVLSQRQVADIVKSHEDAINNLLEKVTHCEAPDVKCIAAHNDSGLVSHIADNSAAPPAAWVASRHTITNDEIIDLRIDLATCRDAMELINKL